MFSFQKIRWKIINFLKIKTYFKTPDREETAENTKMSEKQTRGGKMLFSQRWSLHNFEFQIVPLSRQSFTAISVALAKSYQTCGSNTSLCTERQRGK